MKIPPCASWNVWTGLEIEGNQGLGENTLFIRHCVDWRRYTNKTIKRIWFCHEFTDWKQIREAAQERDGSILRYVVNLEANSRTFDRIPKEIVHLVHIYYKLDIPLGAGHFVCVGRAFADEAFALGEGNQVSPDQYLGDVRLA